MSVLEIYNEFRAKFPGVTKKADEEHIRIWGEIDLKFAYSWFESLAKALNAQMIEGAPVATYKPAFEFIRSKYINGDGAIKNCIDVAFVENLFWQVPPEKAEPYWNALPDILKELYTEFHKSKPF